MKLLGEKKSHVKQQQFQIQTKHFPEWGRAFRTLPFLNSVVHSDKGKHLDFSARQLSCLFPIAWSEEPQLGPQDSTTRRLPRTQCRAKETSVLSSQAGFSSLGVKNVLNGLASKPDLGCIATLSPASVSPSIILLYGCVDDTRYFI